MMVPFDVEAAGGNMVGAMVEAAHDVAKLPRVLVGGGVGKAAAALYVMLFRAPAPGMFLQSRPLFLGVLAAIVLAGVAEAWTGLWLSHHGGGDDDGHDPAPLNRRRKLGLAVLCASLLPLLALAAVWAGSSPLHG